MDEHGIYSVKLESNLLKITLSGMFNELATQAVCQQIQMKVESLQGKVFGILLDCKAYEGSTPEAHQVSNQHLLWLNQHNCTARAIIYSKKFHFNIVKNEQPALYQLQNRREFQDQNEAQSWLKSQL